MGMAVGVALPNGGATVLSDLVNGVFATRSPELDAAAAQYVASEANVLVVSWPAVGNGDEVVYIRLASRPTSPERLAL